MKIAIVALLCISGSLALINPKVMPDPVFKVEIPLPGAMVGKTASGITWTDCDGTGTPYVSLKSVQITGNIQQGSTITIVGSGAVNQPFTIASFDLNILVGSIKLYNGNIPLTEPQSFVAGPQNLTFNEPVPVTPPSGAYKVTARMRDGAGHELQCFYVTFNLS